MTENRFADDHYDWSPEDLAAMEVFCRKADDPAGLIEVQRHVIENILAFERHDKNADPLGFAPYGECLALQGDMAQMFGLDRKSDDYLWIKNVLGWSGGSAAIANMFAHTNMPDEAAIYWLKTVIAPLFLGMVAAIREHSYPHIDGEHAWRKQPVKIGVPGTDSVN